MIGTLRAFVTRAAALFFRARRNQELAEELDSHLQMHIDENVRSGMAPIEARRQALVALGGLEQTKEQYRDRRGLPRLEHLLQDVRQAARATRRTPGLSAAAVLTLALGIGAATAIFTVANAVLLRPPPYPESQRLYVLASPEGSGQSGQVFHYLTQRSRAFESIAAYGGASGRNLVAPGGAQYVSAQPVSERFFDVLGVSPLLGRPFLRHEDQPNGPLAVILSQGLWRHLFAADAEVIGRVIALGGIPHTVVGVMPASFRTFPAADLWTPLRLSPADGSANYVVVARQRRAVSDAEATQELRSLASRMSAELTVATKNQIDQLKWIRYRRWMGLESWDTLRLLLGAVGLLLVIACTNVAGLQLVRSISRRREMAMRSALGGGRLRLIRQVLIESVMLALAGATLGVLMAYLATPTLLQSVPPELLEGRTVDVDWVVLTVALGVAVGAGILFGLAPAFSASRLDLRATLLEGGARTTAGRYAVFLRRAFATVEVALAVVLLVLAGTVVRTFVSLRSVNPGFDPSNVLVGKMSLQGSTARAPHEVIAFIEGTLARVRVIPGVSAAAVANNVPVERGLNLAIEPPAESRIADIRSVDWRYVTRDYFAVLRIPLQAGRVFDERDDARGAGVAIVNETFAQLYFGHGSAVGHVVQLADLQDVPRQIVGVVGDVKARSGAGWAGGPTALGSPAVPTLYVPAAQVPEGVLALVHDYFPTNWIVRARGADLEARVQDLLRAAEPHLPLMRFETMHQVIARDLQTYRLLVTLLAVFATVALVLACTGVYGLIAYSVSQRTQEIGVRMALGATRERILGTFLTEGLSLATIGAALGLGAAALSTRLLVSFVSGAQMLDLLTFGAVAVLLVAMVGVATLVPALQASLIDPMQALRLD